MARPNRSRPPDVPSGRQASPSPNRGKPELIVIARPEAQMRVLEGAPASLGAGFVVAPLAGLLAAAGAVLRPLFGPNDEHVRLMAALLPRVLNRRVPDLTGYYHVEAPAEQLESLAQTLRERHGNIIEAAYVKPAGEAPQINDMAPSAAAPPTLTPDFSSRQGYLNPAPGGIDARYAWTIPGGTGEGVQIIDLEWAWRLSHEDLQDNSGGLIAGEMGDDSNHGTAVLGVFSSDRNSFGVTGICPDANVSTISFSLPTATAIRMAADRLRAGDILLLEIHRPGPESTGRGQEGYIPIEWWPDDFDAIAYAVSKGVIVVEAGGNGGVDLDASIYNQPMAGFPADWTNPFNRANRDSGAIVVGAGAPPADPHGDGTPSPHGPDRSRLSFSNYGAMIDVQGWGREVTSCGYGDLQGGINTDLWYTDRFSGTSSASPIIVGALGCLQGILRKKNLPTVTPERARKLFRTTGSAQDTSTDSGRIGNRPNLKELIAAAGIDTDVGNGSSDGWRDLFNATLTPNESHQWVSEGWASGAIQWQAVATAGGTAPQLQARGQSQADGSTTYYLDLSNATSAYVDFKVRFRRPS